MLLKQRGIGINQVGNAQLAQAPAYTFKGNDTASTANETDLNISLLTATSTLTWSESSAISPQPFQEYGISVYGWAPLLGQSLVCIVQVPLLYIAGHPIKLYNSVYSQDTSGTLLFQTVSTLIRPGTDIISSTTNQRTSTNSAITLSAGTVNIPQAVTYDVTDSGGLINGVSVAVGHLIIINLKRGTDTGVSVARSICLASNLSFN